MSYASVESTIKTILQAMSRFADADVTQGDYRVLDSTTIDDCVVLKPGPFGQADVRAAMSFREWTTVLELFHEYGDEGTTFTNFIASRDDVISTLEKYPTLNSGTGITRIRVYADGDVMPVNDEDGAGPFFVMQQLRVVVSERADISGGEF